MSLIATSLIDLVAGIFKPAAELVDELHTSEEERINAKGRMLEVQALVLDKALNYEKETLAARANIVEAEAKSEHFLTAAWRPITMLTFLALVVLHQFELLAIPLADDAWTLLQIGLGGYVGGRSVEKVIKEVKR